MARSMADGCNLNDVRSRTCPASWWIPG
jgi:hypothetical protein